MSVQFGRWNFDGQPVDLEYVGKVDAVLAPYAPDGYSSYSAPGITVLYHSFHTTKESRREKQPHILNSGAMVTWDGRLDNREELIRELAGVLTASSTDAEIAAAAYEGWGENSFAKLIGDWALAIVNPVTRSVILAKDVIGTRHLYYAVEESRITWSTILDPLVLLAARKFQLCEEYVAGWLGFFPATHLTPYIGIDSVPPSSFVCLRPGKREVKKYWDFDPHKRIRYRTDADYEEHFRVVFGEAVRRRLRSDSPVLAELSGGMDSSSIVCMADEIIARGAAETPRLDTVSYYDDSEPNWNELPYIARIEERRGRTGCHINLFSDAPFRNQFRMATMPIIPASVSANSKSAREYRAFASSRGTRVVLSGTGGDEVAGGIPTAIPALADLLIGGHIPAFIRQLKTAALQNRKPWLLLLIETIRVFVPVSLTSRGPGSENWLDPNFGHRYRKALLGYQERLCFSGSLPHFQVALRNLEGVRRIISSTPASFDPPFQTSYPFLARGVLEFLFACPPEQLVRPGHRRSLLRRSLTGLVPGEILGRRRKAFVSRAPLLAISRDWELLQRVNHNMVSGSAGIVNQASFQQVLERALDGRQVPIVGVLRSIALEAWIRSALKRGVLNVAGQTSNTPPIVDADADCLTTAHSYDLS